MATVNLLTPQVITGITYSQDASSYRPDTNPIAVVGFAKMNDGSATTGGCSTGNGTPTYLQADCGTPKYISSAVFGYDTANSIPGGFGTSYLEGVAVQGSLDNSAWTTIATVPTYSAATYPNGLYTLSVNQVYRYIRLYRSSGGYIATTEFSLVGGLINFESSLSFTADARNSNPRSSVNLQSSFGLTADAVSSSAPRITTTTYTQSGLYGSGNVLANYTNMNDNNASGASGATATTQTSNSWIKADCGSQYNINKLVYGYDYLRNLYGGWGPAYSTGVKVQGSNDDINWTDILTLPTYASTGSTNGLAAFTINGKYRYIRLQNSSYFPATEFSLWGTQVGSGFFAMF